ncbi:MAG: Rne/Rng family ribonuclease [Candidatus Omnitrophica bacterium]|nr:Rne/Rng family ribonuclease [Candidatus Omnitrophota bacterium]
MASRILIAEDPLETRIAVLENEQLVELFIQPSGKKKLIGNIYIGRVSSVIPGLEAAFVDIGIGRNAFLHVRDFLPQPGHDWRDDIYGANGNGVEDADSEEIDPADVEGAVELEVPKESVPVPLNISDYLVEGQSVLVQMEKEPLGQKGCRVTANISLPGRYIVFFPNAAHVAISRRIEDDGERERLEKIGQELTQGENGIILRTAAEGAEFEDLQKEYNALKERWLTTKNDSENAEAPALIYEDAGILTQVIRDQLSPQTQSIFVEGDEAYEKVFSYVSQIMPEFQTRVRHYQEAIPLFRARGIESEIERLLQRRVWLKSGGYLVIDETEALTVIDVNTGRDRGGSNLEETALATNLEAIPEVARQLRLRDIGGIIIVDFIDMLSTRNQSVVMEQLQAALAEDRSHPTLFSMTELGLVQLTRKRVRKSLLRGLSQPCPYCKGEGVIFAKSTMVTRILRRLEELLLEDPRDSTTLHVHPTLSEEINTNWSDYLQDLAARYDTRVRVVAEPGIHLEGIRESFET